MIRITNRNDFVSYIMKTLGHPVITVNVTEEQVNYRIDDALLKFYEFHTDGTYHYFYQHQLSSTDISTKKIKLPADVISVLKVYPSDGLFSVTRGGNGNNLAMTGYLQNVGSNALGGIYGVGGIAGGLFPTGNGVSGFSRSASYGGMSNFMYTSNYLGSITGTVTGEHSFQYIKHGNYIIISDFDMGVGEGDFILVECFREVNEENHPIWDSIWLRNYAVALTKKQWGQNLVKFGNTQLANGTTINGEVILSEANNEIKDLEDELKNEWQPPLGVLVG